MNFVLVGAGGHAKAIVEGLQQIGGAIAQYVDPIAAPWLAAEHLRDDNDADPETGALALGVGGMDPASLVRRLALLDNYLARGFDAPPVIHPAAVVSADARMGAGVVVLAGAIVQPNADLARGVIVNTAAIVEHDSQIDAGSHLGPRALILGGCHVGETTMIGAGAVIMPGAEVASRQTVPALMRYPK